MHLQRKTISGSSFFAFCFFCFPFSSFAFLETASVVSAEKLLISLGKNSLVQLK